MKDGDIEITFTNAGDKIPGDMLQTIFEKFYRVDGSRSTGTGGAGLGLAIAKQIVELHGGRILAKSDDNRTQFVVTLPSKEKTEQKEGSEDEVHTHRRLAFRGKKPDAGNAYSQNREQELWDSFRDIITICNQKKTDLLLIAGTCSTGSHF